MAEKELKLVEHLEELRKRMIIVGAAFVIFFAIGLMFWILFYFSKYFAVSH